MMPRRALRGLSGSGCSGVVRWCVNCHPCGIQGHNAVDPRRRAVGHRLCLGQHSADAAERRRRSCLALLDRRHRVAAGWPGFVAALRFWGQSTSAYYRSTAQALACYGPDSRFRRRRRRCACLSHHCCPDRRGRRHRASTADGSYPRRGAWATLPGPQVSGRRCKRRSPGSDRAGQVAADLAARADRHRMQQGSTNRRARGTPHFFRHIAARRSE